MEPEICEISSCNKCKWCKKDFCSPKSLQKHMTTAKYCMKTRGEVQIPSYNCKWCNQTFNQNWYLNRHLQTCRDKNVGTKKVDELETQIRQLRQLLEEKEKKIQKIIEEKDAIIIDQKLKIAHDSGKVEVLENFKPTNITNVGTMNNEKAVYLSPKLLKLPISNIRPLTRKLIKEYINEFYDCCVYEQGYDGLFCFIKNLVFNNDNNYDGVFERNLVCSDKMNNTFYKLDYDEIKKMKKWESDGMGLSIEEILRELAPYTNQCSQDFNKKKNTTEEDKKLALETLAGITASDTGARLALFKRLRSDLKQYLTI